MRSFWQPINRLSCALCFFFLSVTVNVFGEGTPQVAPNGNITINGNTTNDVAALHIGNDQFNSFASYDNQNVNSRLNIHITDPSTECIYLGFSFGHLNNTSQNPTRQNFEYRILDPNGNIVYGPVIVRSDMAHIPDWQSAVNGPEQLNGPGGYAAELVSSADLSSQGFSGKGDYYIEFRNVSGNNPLLIDYWDISVVDCSGSAPIEKPGRLWSYNWALFAINDYGFPNRPFNGSFYVCAPDPVNPDAAFITQIDFNGSGFRPAAFNVAFNSFGTANTGNITEDRKSVENVNSAEPEYAIFLNDPVDICDTAETGEIEIFGISSCDAQNYCIKFVSSRSGQIDILLDFDGGDNVFTPGTADVMLTSFISPEDVGVDMCLDWNGLNGLGESVYDITGIEIPITLSFAQGIYHFPIYDAELMTEGYTIHAVRPTGSDPKLYYDDSNMTVLSGSGENPINLSGCDLPCHSWTNYSNPGTVGFGNLCTINSWWFSQQIESQSVFILPSYIECSIFGPEGLCEGSVDVLEAVNEILPEDNGDIEIISSKWFFSGFILAEDTTSVEITDAGEYFYSVEWIAAAGDTCSSACSIKIEELENSSSTVDTMITYGDTLILNNEMYFQQGTYEQILVSSNGCDSTVTVILDFLDPVYTCEIIGESPICFGDTTSLEVILNLDPPDAVPLPINEIEWAGPGISGTVTGEEIDATRQGTYIAVASWTNSDGGIEFTECSFDLVLNPRFALTIDTLIVEGEVLDVNGLIITEPGEYKQEFVSVNGCDSTIFINVISQEAIVFYGFEDCKSIDFSRFTPEYPTEVLCGTLKASNVYRVDPSMNGHSCTPGIGGGTAVCIGSLDDCTYDPESDKRLIFELEVYPEVDSVMHITSLNFFERAPEEFQWEIGTSGPNNYPLYYGLRVFINGEEVFNKFDIPTTTDWTREIFNFVNIDEFIITEASLLRFELLPYCLAGVDSHVNAWDIDALSIQGSCGLLEFKSSQIGGSVVHHDGSGFSDLIVQLHNQDSGKLVSEHVSSEYGEYAFEDIQKNQNYRVSTHYDEDHLNGVSTADIIKIQRHILGLEQLSSPYLMIAADVDNSGSISALDLIQLKKLILGIYDEFPQNDSWVFHDASEELSLVNPWSYRNHILVNDLDDPQNDQRLNAIKIGDVNLDNSLIKTQGSITSRSRNTALIEVQDIKLVSGEMTETELVIRSDELITGIQMDIDLSELHVRDLYIDHHSVPGTIEFHEQANVLSVIYYNPDSDDLLKEIPITIQIISNRDQYLNKAIKINNERIEAQAFTRLGSDINSGLVKFAFDSQSTDHSAVVRIQPNPFTDLLTIHYESETVYSMVLNVYSLHGERIRSYDMTINEGSNSIEINSAELGEYKGILLLEILTGNRTEYHRVLRF